MVKKYVRYSKAVAAFIIKCIEEEDLLVEQACKKYKESLPDARTIYRWSSKHEEFAAMMDAAYTTWLMSRMSELNEISSKPAQDLFPELDFKAAEATRKARMDALKYTLAKMAPILSKRFHTSSKIEHTGKVDAPTIIIKSYAEQEEVDKHEK